VEATTGEHALRLAIEVTPAAIVVGAAPHGDVATLCHQLKAAPGTAAIPVIHTSSSGERRPSEPLKCPADVCLGSRVKQQTLVATLKSAVHPSVAARPGEEPSPRRHIAAETGTRRHVEAVEKLEELVAVSTGSPKFYVASQTERLHPGVTQGEHRDRDITSAAFAPAKARKTMLPNLTSAARILSSVLDSTVEGVIISDEAGMILASSKRTAEILGDIASNCSGREVALLDSPEIYGADGCTRVPDGFGRLVRLACSGCETRDIELFVRAKDPAGTWVLCDAVPLRRENGRVGGCLLTIRDISARKRAEDAVAATQRELEEKTGKLALSNEKLARSNRELQQFASVVGHDVKSPLSTISTLTTWLCEEYGDTMDSEARAYVACLQKAVQRIDTLVTAVQEYARLGSAQRRPSAQVDCSEALAWVMASLQPEIRASAAVVTFSPLPVVCMNGNDLEQVLHHLVLNAVRYGRPGVPPKVHVSAERTGKDWVFSVSDNGAGVDVKDPETLFEPLGRMHSSDSSGAGLGLAICRRIVELYGGRIWLKSILAEGSIFCFSIPVDPEGTEPPSP
jgi:signal transduction histidine kinase